MTVLKSYDLNGKKLSFANWISNLSPQDTPFTSMTGKESIQQTLFQWQTDTLAKAGRNAQLEGDEAKDDALHSTNVKTNITQILRKTVKVSDTANALANYGRGKELQYQMEKAGKEIKRDLEWVFLNNVNSQQEVVSSVAGQSKPRKTAGFRGLVAPLATPDLDTGAIVHAKSTTDDVLTEKDLFNMTYNLYLAGSRADIIMFHPKWASFFSSLQEKSTDGNRARLFENTPKFSVYVSTIVDPLGQHYKLVPNRWMPQDQVFIFNTSDWTQMVLRAPQRTKLAKDGSYEKWMIEMEVGLRHRNPYASGIIDIDHSDTPPGGDTVWSKANFKYQPTAASSILEQDVKSNAFTTTVASGSEMKFIVKSQASIPTPAPSTGTAHTPAATDVLYVIKDGVEFGHWTCKPDATDKELMMTVKAGPEHNGHYYVQYKDATGKVWGNTATVTVKVI